MSGVPEQLRQLAGTGGRLALDSVDTDLLRAAADLIDTLQNEAATHRLIIERVMAWASAYEALEAAGLGLPYIEAQRTFASADAALRAAARAGLGVSGG